jgi:hypothetical protein
MKRMANVGLALAAFFGISVTLWLFYPGYLSWDSAYQWWQVRHHLIDPAHPPIMVMIWRSTDALIPGPGGYFIYQIVLYWLSLLLFIQALNYKIWLKVFILLGLGFWPPLWGLSLHVWKDIACIAFFCLAAAALAQDFRLPNRAWRLLALLSVVLACAYRFNAMSAGLIFIFYIIYRELKIKFSSIRKRKTLAATISAIVVVCVQIVVIFPAYLLNQKSEPLWPLQAQWDIAAVSVHENQLLFPPAWSSPKLTMAMLKRDFDPSVNVPLFKSGLIYVNPYQPMREQDFAALKKTWLQLPLDHPRAYWQHRWYISQNLFGLIEDTRHPNFVFALSTVNYKDNPTIITSSNEQTRSVKEALAAMIETPFFWGWCYLTLAMLCLVYGWRKGNTLAAMLSLSAICYALPLIVLAPSCDFRYLGWLLQGSLLAATFLFMPTADKRLRQ